MTRLCTLFLGCLLMACSAERPAPATLDPRADQCAWCRMAVSSPAFAAQLVAPGEEPRFFDDLGCLVTYLKQPQPPPPQAVAYVADHRSGEWVVAARATYTRVDALSTPMGSHLIAHATAVSRDADPDARGGVPVDAGSLLPRPFPDGVR